jgi:hypothetical protein
MYIRSLSLINMCQEPVQTLSSQKLWFFFRKDVQRA